MAERHDVVILGAGPAGMTAAFAAKSAGARVTLVTDGPVGGRSGWHSLLPSKILLHEAERVRRQDTPELVASLMQRIERTSRRFHELEVTRLREAGVRILEGRAQFKDDHRLDVEGHRAVSFDAAVVATGSVPVFPDGLVPDGEHVLAPRFVRNMKALPESIMIIGGGVTGSEFVYGFSALGVRVTWIPGIEGVLPRFDRRLAKSLVASMETRGVRFVDGADVVGLAVEGGAVAAQLADGRSERAARAFLAVGRRPDLESLALGNAGVELRDGRLLVDDRARSHVPHILGAGDVTGGPMTATKAVAQGHTAGRVAAGAEGPALRPASWIEATYTVPEVAQVGLTPDRAAEGGMAVETREIPFTRALRAFIDSEEDSPPGFVQITCEPGSRRVVGATGFGPAVSEVLAPIALAIALDASIDGLSTVFPAYPTISELPFLAARG